MSKSRAIKLSGRLSVLALLAGVGGGCSSMFNLDGPTFTGSTPNQQQVISGQVAPAPTAAVQASDLPPPAGGAPAPAYAAAAPTPTPAPYTPPKPYAANGMPMPIGQVAAAQPAAPASTPAAPATTGAAPTTLGAQASRIGGAGATHTVAPGDTMWNVSQRYGVPVEQVIAANGGTTNIRLGQKLVIPGGSAPAATANVQLAAVDPRATPAPTPAVAKPAVATAAEIVPPAPAAQAPAPAAQTAAVAPQAATGAAAPAAPAASAASEGFRWPVRGRVISGFGKKADGERNDGINLAVPEGSAVKAAEDGTVIYAGNELKSYGNLVLIRHSNGWVSAYAHNSELKVTRGQQIRRGEIVALSGMSGGVTTPQVHFELRKDATPVDPLQHLSES